MAVFLKKGNMFFPSDKKNLDVHEHLPVGNYVVKVDQNGVMFLEEIEQFKFSGKRYGNNIRHTERIFSTFKDRENSTGVLLAGQKGSGKSLLAKTLSIRAAEEGIPTIVINTPFHGDVFNKFIQDINQPCVILFDEFEKVYDNEQQESLLTLLDGVFPSKKMFVLTCNNVYRIDEHMRNRPGRIFYMIEFKGLEENFIREYCEDNLKDKQYINQIVQCSYLFNEMNFDMLKAMVEEMNRYGESPQEVLEMLNTKPIDTKKDIFNIELFVDGVKIPGDQLDDEKLHGHPMYRVFRVDYLPDKNKKDDDDWENILFEPNHIVSLNGGVYTLVRDNAKVVLTREVREGFDYRDLLF